MDLRSLEYFVAVADERSFTRAAQRCHVTQPTISGQITALERELGEPLFDRAARAMSLTDGGEILLPYARQCLAAAENAKAEFSARAGLLRGEFRFGTGGGVENTSIPMLLGALRKTHPGIDVHLTEATSAPLVEMVAQGRLHAAVIARPQAALPTTIASAPMFSGRLVAVFDPSAFSFDEPVAITALAGQPVITYPSSSALRSRLDAVIAESGTDITVNYVANDVRLQLAFARQAVGIAICADSDPALQDCPDLAIRALAPPVTFDKILVWRNDIAPNAATRAFFAIWKEFSAAARESA
ncbi:LysR family transcriptional regulator [Mycolicibacterium cosmeticum]|uniref:LysR family transcriptional regulator n=1 Tax=Mycolicibacterium cosmeticum TaxID=258533 RepID=UPI003204D74C